MIAIEKKKHEKTHVFSAASHESPADFHIRQIEV
jgi:hypothetical protein